MKIFVIEDKSFEVNKVGCHSKISCLFNLRIKAFKASYGSRLFTVEGPFAERSCLKTQKIRTEELNQKTKWNPDILTQIQMLSAQPGVKNFKNDEIYPQEISYVYQDVA